MPPLIDLDAWLRARECAVPDLRAGLGKEVIWADGVQKTPLSVVFVHGFSASKGELRPLADIVAKELGANLFYTRLAGHGRDGAAMGQASVEDWTRDVLEAFEIGALIGDEVIVIGCSTGCTLATWALARGARAKGVVHVSPNFGMTHKIAQFLLGLPGVRRWGPLLIGRETAFEPISPEHEAMWTTRYDSQAVFTMAETVRAAHDSDIEAIDVPAYFAFCEDDRVVSPARTRKIMARWGGEVVQDVLVKGPTDDKMGHVMAGDVMSPTQTEPLARRLIEWVRGL